MLHVGKLARRPIDSIKQEKNIGDKPRSDVLIELFNCGGGVCREGVVKVSVEEFVKVFVEKVFVEVFEGGVCGGKCGGKCCSCVVVGVCEDEEGAR